MKLRATILTAVIALLLAPLAGAAPTSRTDTVAYDGPNGVMIDTNVTPGSPTVRIFTIDSENVMAQPGERYVSIEIADESGQPLAAAVHQGGAELGTICGRGEHLQLVNKKPLHLHLEFGVSADCGAASVPSNGTITFTFHR